MVSLPVHEQAAAFAAGDVDAVITFAGGPALKAGARRIFDSRRLPGEIVDVLVVDRQRVTREQRRRLRALWFDALRTRQDNRGETDPRLHARRLTPMALQVTLDGLLMGDRAVNRGCSTKASCSRASASSASICANAGCSTVRTRSI